MMKKLGIVVMAGLFSISVAGLSFADEKKPETAPAAAQTPGELTGKEMKEKAKKKPAKKKPAEPKEETAPAPPAPAAAPEKK